MPCVSRSCRNLRSKAAVVVLGCSLGCGHREPPAPPDHAEVASLQARDAAVALVSPDRIAILDATSSAGDTIAAHGCTASVLGSGFRDAPILCLGAIAAALTSTAIEDPPRAQAVTQQLERILALALAPAAQAAFSSTGSIHVLDRDVPRSVLYRGMLALVLAGLERLAPASAHSSLFDAVAGSLATDVSAGWVATYGAGEIWPCDHAPSSSGLRLHAVLRHASVSVRAADVLAARLRSFSGAFPTRVDRDGKVVDAEERGTALAFTAGFLLPGEPELAAEFANRFVVHCSRPLPGMGACREWLSGFHTADAASGPLVQGYSVGATALGLAASRALTSDWNAVLLRAAAMAGADALDPRQQPLESAFFRWGETARSWR